MHFLLPPVREGLLQQLVTSYLEWLKKKQKKTSPEKLREIILSSMEAL